MRGVLLLAAWLLVPEVRGASLSQTPTLAAEVVFRGLAATDQKGHFWLLDVYKGADHLGALLGLDPGEGGVYNLRDRLVNVSGWNAAPQQGQYIVYCDLQDGGRLASLQSEPWTPEGEDAVWAATGWQPWSEWSACSASCGEGIQERRRFCRQPSCPGYNKENRRCNMFSCQGTVSPLDLEDRRFFHPSRSHWEHVPGRNTAWRLRPNSYIWVPSTQLFPPPGHFPKEFSLLVTLRLQPQTAAHGTVFSLRSRRQQDAYLSLELNNDSSGVKLIHSGHNGTQSVDIPVQFGDHKWHQLAIALKGDNSVTSHVDCSWVSTEVLHKNSLVIPEDVDLVIGYLFEGDVEQLTVVPDTAAVAQQCSLAHTSLLDPELMSATLSPLHASYIVANIQDVQPRQEERQLDARSVAGSDIRATSGREHNLPRQHRASQHHLQEIAWSDWSECSSSCGPGTQTRRPLCAGRLQSCTTRQPENRSCSRAACQPDILAHDTAANTSLHRVLAKLHLHAAPGWRRCGCLHGGKCSGGEDKSCICPAGYSGRHCEHVSCRKDCLHGGWCSHPDHCSCPRHYTGPRCETPVCEPACRHGGVCVAPHACHCPRGTSGSYCQTFSCKYPCLNGGACVGPDQCECPRNATGPTCATPVCDPPCENGATCGAGNTCVCVHGTSGMRCEKRLGSHYAHVWN